MTYIKVRLRPGHTVLLERVSPNTGWRVETDGVRWSKIVDNKEQMNLVVFNPHDIITEMKMNFHYGKLEPKS